MFKYKKIWLLIVFLILLFLVSFGLFFLMAKKNLEKIETNYRLLTDKEVEQVLVSYKWCGDEGDTEYVFFPDGTFKEYTFEIDINSETAGNWSLRKNPSYGGSVLFLSEEHSDQAAFYFEIDTEENLHLFPFGLFKSCEHDISFAHDVPLPEPDMPLAETVLSDTQAPELWQEIDDKTWQKDSGGDLDTYPSRIRFFSYGNYRFDYANPNTGTCWITAKFSLNDNVMYREIPGTTSCGGNKKMEQKIVSNSLKFKDGVLRFEGAEYSLVE